MSDQRDKGAHFFRCDFQVHTPRDRAWKGKAFLTDDERKAYAQSLVEACRQRELQAIAVTDHHDLCFFTFIKAAAIQETDLVGELLPAEERLIVFPAVELTLNVPCQAILILDADFPETVLPQVLTTLAITPAPIADSKAADVIRVESITTLEGLKTELDKHVWLKDRYIVLPNVTTDGHDTLLRKGANLKYAAMPCVGGYLDGSISKCKAGELKILAGEDKAWGNKRIAIFQTSDTRSEDHSSLGQSSTWVKWAIPTAEALRQACLAQDSRVSQDAPQLPAVVIRSINVSNSDFLGPIKLILNPQYTALIGSRGTGKSTILEYLRWGLCDEHDADEDEGTESVGVRQQRLVENTLKKYDATVEIRFEVNGVAHLVRRRSATGEVLLKIGEADLQTCTKEDIQSLLPIEAYSQKQLSRVGHRVDDLNEFVRAGIKTDLDSIEGQVRGLVSHSRQVYSQLRRKQTIEKSMREDRLSIKSLSQQAQSIRDSLTGLSPEQQQLLSRQPAYLEGDLQIGKWDQEIRDIQMAILNLSKRLASVPSAPKSPLETHPEKETLERVQELIEARVGALAAISAQLEAEIGKVLDAAGERQGDYKDALSQWANAKKSFGEAYQAAKAAASSHETQIKSLGELEQKIQTISQRVGSTEAEIATLGDPETEFKAIRAQWKELHKKKGDLYSEQCEKLTELSDGIIRATARRGSDVKALEDRIKSITRGSGLRGQKIEDMLGKICDAADPIALWDSLLDELELLAHHTPGEQSSTKPDSPSLTQMGFADGDLTRLAEKLSPENWLELALTSLDDETTFEYQTKEQEYIPFENASAGQQATALLISLLNQSGPPLVIDQPEDDLDNQIIFEIVKRIWRAKTRRQLIFSSHNANLVVNGDAELVVWCDYRVAGDYSGGRIAEEGAIDMPIIRDTIKAVMEGGEKAFKLRLDKYGF